MFKLTMTTALLYLLYLVVVPTQAAAATGVETTQGWWVLAVVLAAPLFRPLLRSVGSALSR